MGPPLRTAAGACIVVFTRAERPSPKTKDVRMKNMNITAEHANTEAVSIKKFSSNSGAQRVIVNLFTTTGQQFTYDRFDTYEAAASFVDNVTGREWFPESAKSTEIKAGGRRFIEGGVMTYYTLADDI